MPDQRSESFTLHAGAVRRLRQMAQEEGISEALLLQRLIFVEDAHRHMHFDSQQNRVRAKCDREGCIEPQNR